MTKGIFYVIASYFIVIYCHAQEAPQKNLDIDIKQDLKNYLLIKYDDIKISEIYRKNNNKKDFLKTSLGSSLLKEALDINTHHIYFKKLSDDAETHLGIVYLFYETPGKARNAIATIEKSGFFENTRILTKYVAVNADSVNLVVFTESSADKIALEYLDSVSSKIPSNTDKK